MNEYLEVVVRTLLAIGTVFVFAKFNGSKLISQLTFYDYVVGITAGSIAATLCVQFEINIWICVIATALFMTSAHIISYLTSKSMVLRRIFTGKPHVLIKDGEIVWSGLKKAFFDVNDLLRELRCQGYFDLSQINCAVLENNGQLSVLLKASARPATTGEQGMTLKEDAIPALVLIDGKAIKGNLAAQGFNPEWLYDQLKNQGYENPKDVALATYSDGNLSVYRKTNEGCRTVFQ